MPPPVIRKWRPILEKIPNFGKPITSNEHGFFEWPKPADIEQLGLSEPLKLKVVYAKWLNSGGDLKAIQLVFEGGYTSPMFDCKDSGT